MLELWFLHSAHCLMLIDICMKFRDKSLKGFQVIVWTRIRHNFMTDIEGNYSKSKHARVTVLALCMSLMLVDISMKIHEESLKGFQVIKRTLLRRDLMKVKVPREITQKV